MHKSLLFYIYCIVGSTSGSNYLTIKPIFSNLETVVDNTFERKFVNEKSFEVKNVEDKLETKLDQEELLIKTVNIKPLREENPKTEICTLVEDCTDVTISTTNENISGLKTKNVLCSDTILTPASTHSSPIDNITCTPLSPIHSEFDETLCDLGTKKGDEKIETIEEIIITDKETDEKKLANQIIENNNIQSEKYEHESETILIEDLLPENQLNENVVKEFHKNNQIEEISNEVISTEKESAFLKESANIEELINEKNEDCDNNNKENQIKADIFEAWNEVNSNNEQLLTEMNVENKSVNINEKEIRICTDSSIETTNPDFIQNKIEIIDCEIKSDQSHSTVLVTSEEKLTEIEETKSNLKENVKNTENVENVEIIQKIESDNDNMQISQKKNVTLLEETISIEKIINEGNENWKEEQVQAAILAAAWDAVHPNTEKLLAEAVLERVSSLIINMKFICLF